jgi:hypothetical protein
MAAETFGVATEIHPEWYMPGEEKYIDDTLLFGSRLVEAGYNVKYMHGPVCLHEGAVIAAVSSVVPDDESSYLYFTRTHEKDYIYFLYQVKEDQRRIRYARVSNIDWEYVSKKQAVKSQSQVMDEEV